jgi:hypothetical protein
MTKQTSQSSNINKRKNRYFGFLGIIIATISYLIIDYYGPKEIPLEKDHLLGMSVTRAKDLLVQEYDSEDRLWATRGMCAYRLNIQKKSFERQYHVPTGISFYWLRNFTIVRLLTKRPECIELLPSTDGSAVAMSAGRMWHRPSENSKFTQTLKLRHYRISGDLGIWHGGLVKLYSGSILFGEYFRNSKHTDVRLYRSNDGGKNWDVAYEFPAGQIRHIHAVQQDPYTGKIWVLTGDEGKAAMMLWSSDEGKTLNLLGGGQQKWRVTQLVFTPNDLFWGVDTPKRDSNETGIFQWDKNNDKLKKIANVNGAIYYATRLANGTIIMSTVREGGANETDGKTRLWVITNENEVNSFVFGTWDWKKKHAKLRFSRNQGAKELAISVLNHKEHNNELILVPEEELITTAKKRQTQ